MANLQHSNINMMAFAVSQGILLYISKTKVSEIEDFLKKIRDAGLMVGVSTHMPAVVEYIEDKNWDVDFYMTCVYERHRSREELKNPAIR